MNEHANRTGFHWFGSGAGEDADPRMTAAAKQRGVILTSKSRPLKPDDLERFDYIIGMDPKNLKAMKVSLAPLLLPAILSWSVDVCVAHQHSCSTHISNLHARFLSKRQLDRTRSGVQHACVPQK